VSGNPGWRGAGREFERVSGFTNASDRHDFIVVYPDGHDDNSHPAPGWMAAESKWRSWWDCTR
jgi:poly(3-hydroxybutyrate) depolymerase